MVHIMMVCKMKGNLKKLLIPPVMRESMRLTNCCRPQQWPALTTPSAKRPQTPHLIVEWQGCLYQFAQHQLWQAASPHQAVSDSLLQEWQRRTQVCGRAKDLGSQLSIWEARRLGVWQVVYTRFLVKYQPWQGQSSTGFPHTIS